MSGGALSNAILADGPAADAITTLSLPTASTRGAMSGSGSDFLGSIPETHATSFASRHHEPGMMDQFWDSSLGQAISELKHTRIAHAIKRKVYF